MKLFMLVRTWHYSFFFTVIFVIVHFTFYCSCHYSCIVFVLFMAWFNVLFSFYCSCQYSCIVFVSLYKAYESIVLGRHGKTGKSSRVELTCIFKQGFFFFFFQLQKQINDNLFRENVTRIWDNLTEFKVSQPPRMIGIERDRERMETENLKTIYWAQFIMLIQYSSLCFYTLLLY